MPMAKVLSLNADANKVLASYDRMESYRIQEDILQNLISSYPDHKNKAAVEVKAKLLNLLYSTSINAINLMAKHIMDIQDIDKRLKTGDLTLVPEIACLELADGSSRNNYSFATKYCAYHQPSKFPIYDSIVAAVFTKLFEDGHLNGYVYASESDTTKRVFNKGGFKEKLKDYRFYVEVYNAFMKQYDLESLTYRQVDSYLWGAYKLAGKDYEIERLAPIDKKKISQVEV